MNIYVQPSTPPSPPEYWRGGGSGILGNFSKQMTRLINLLVTFQLSCKIYKYNSFEHFIFHLFTKIPLNPRNLFLRPPSEHGPKWQSCMSLLQYYTFKFTRFPGQSRAWIPQHLLIITQDTDKNNRVTYAFVMCTGVSKYDIFYRYYVAYSMNILYFQCYFTVFRILYMRFILCFSYDVSFILR